MKPHWPRPDFLAAPPGTPRLAWLWLGTAAAVLAVSAHEVWALKNSAADLSQALARAESSLKKASLGINGRPGARVSADSNPDAPRKAQAVVQLLNHPWGQILSTLEMETPPGLQWLVFDRSADSAELRFEGLVPNSEVALDLVTRLSARKGWKDVVLSRLQAPDTGSVEARTTEANKANLWRFEIKALFDGKVSATGSAAAQSNGSQ